MGRIKTQLIKRLSFDAMEKHGEQITEDFEENKRIVSELLGECSKKVRNTVAGYVTRLKKTEEI